MGMRVKVGIPRFSNRPSRNSSEAYQSQISSLMTSSPPAPVSIPVSFQDGPGKIHGFSTGLVSVKSAYLDAKGGQLTSKLRFLLQSHFTEFMPIWVWVVEHPEGIFVIDTGENAQVSEPGYFDQESFFLRWVNQTQFRFQVSKEEEVGPQLRRLGIANDQITSVVLTHLHLDHFDGLAAFEGVDILLNRQEWEHPSAALPSLYPDWLAPNLLDLSTDAQPGFAAASLLTQSGEVKLISTPGHTPHHCSVLVQTKELTYCLAGDASYNQAQLLNNRLSAGHMSFRQARDSMQRIRSFAQHSPLVYLPSHDAGSGERLKQGEVIG
jgi:glyoxylase-like metal-dependent hydrolase (beta-lactamase superfamily II)